MSATVLAFPGRPADFSLTDRAALAAWSAASGWSAALRPVPRHGAVASPPCIALTPPGVVVPLLGIQCIADACEVFILASGRVLAEFASLPAALEGVAPALTA